MRAIRSKQNILRIAVVGLLLMLAMPATAFADKRGRSRNRDFDKRFRKCEKFINCHDARDGRWDNRGRRGRFDSRRFDNRRFDNRRFDNRGFDNRGFDSRRFDNRWWLARQRRLDRSDFRQRRFGAREINRFNTIPLRRGIRY